ncbi:hypothetical protein E3C22_15835 [Jiella endophytica]|uniref:Uncharacterized protein n=1 Tax=Jiella endophytica TaxID=2558362 RepID=A0A4Y8RJI2_9HYPH|nr:hypothetical protein [Jiella endophytica]TFF22104.1 hypothetical protein E3C22_15835 [Jiella endophytica]
MLHARSAGTVASQLRRAALAVGLCLAWGEASAEDGAAAVIALFPVQLAGEPDTLSPDVSGAMLGALRKIAKGRRMTCPDRVTRLVTAGESQLVTARTLQSANEISEAEIAEVAASADGLLLVHSFSGTGYPDPYTGKPRMAAEIRYRLLDPASETVLLQGSEAAAQLDGGRCNADDLSGKAAEADRKAAIACFEAALGSAYPHLVDSLPAKIVGAAACPPIFNGPGIIVAVDRRPEAALRSPYNEIAVLEGLREVVASLPSTYPKQAFRQADDDVAKRFSGGGETEEADIGKAAARLAGKADYLLVYTPTAKAGPDDFTQVMQLEAAIKFKLFDVAAGEMVADGKFETSGEMFTGCAASIGSVPAQPACVRRFVANTLKRLARDMAEKVVFTLASRATAQ